MHRVATEAAVVVSATTVMAALVLLLGTALSLAATQAENRTVVAPSGCIESAVTPLADSGVTGMAWLCHDRGHLQPVIQVRGLHEGDVYTAWLAYFERPAACFHTPCGFIDLRGSEPVGVLGRMDGAIAGAGRDLDLRGALRDLHLSPGAQVTLVVLNHGVGNDLSGQARARQILTPQMFDLGAPLAGPIGDPIRSQLHAQAIFTIE